VAALVLKDNTLQTLALSVAEQTGARKLDAQIALMHTLEKKGALTRAIEYLPNDQKLAGIKAAGLGLTRPELAVLLAYSKMDLYKSLIESTLLDDGYFEAELLRYFPALMQKEYRETILSHPLKREIIGTMLTNSTINRMGCTFVNDLVDAHDASPSDIVAAYALVRDAFNIRDHLKSLDSMTAKMPIQNLAELYSRIQRFVKALVIWLLKNNSLPLNLSDIRTRIVVPTQRRMSLLQQHPAAKARVDELVAAGAPAGLAQFLSNLDAYGNMFDIVHLAQKSGINEDAVSEIYSQIANKLSGGNA